MCRKISQHNTSNRPSQNQLSTKETIGDLFRDYGEKYINIYRPPLHHIKLIRAIRICKTSFLGGRVIDCKSCGHQHFIYHSCGHSQCMLCQSIKREQWMDKLNASLLDVPYLHMVFTLPHILNGLARNNEKIIYSLLLKVAWLTVKHFGNHQGFNPGMTSVLHTFGSDMKYHIHVHALVTFGGLDDDNKWMYPIKKYALQSYRKVCAVYKSIFISELKKLHDTNKINYHSSIDDILKNAQSLRWVVHTAKPTMNTAIIENYLARYINRIAVSKQRLQYIKENNEVQLLFNDYKLQVQGKPAPKALLYLDPIIAIHTIMQHVLPPRFQKSRNYGLHNNASKFKHLIPTSIKRNPITIRKIFEIITALIQQKPYECEKCKSQEFIILPLLPNKNFIYQFINLDSLKSPPIHNEIASKNLYAYSSNVIAIHKNQKKSHI